MIPERTQVVERVQYPLRQRGTRRSAWAVDVGAVVDPEDVYLASRVDDFVDDAIRATPGGVETGELSPERVADTVGTLDQWAEDELDDCRGRLLG